MIWHGPKHESIFGDETLGEIIYKFLREGDPLEVVLIDVEIGLEVTKEKILKSSVALAKYLKDAGVCRGDVIGIISPNTWKYAIPILAAFYLAATVTFSNPNYLEGDLRHFLDITKPKVLLVTEDVYKKLYPIIRDNKSLKAIILFQSAEETNLPTLDMLTMNDSHEVDFPIQFGTEEDIAIVPFSSGTTGLPKGVMISHRALKNTLTRVSDPCGLAMVEGSIILHTLPMFHLFGLILTLICLTNHVKCVLLRTFKPELFLKTIQDYRVTYLPTVPALLQFIAKTDLLDRYDISSVRNILTGSAPAGNEIEELVCKRVNNVYPRQVYGCTETCGSVTCNPIGAVKPGSVGCVVSGAVIKLIDCSSGKTLGTYQSGEICVKCNTQMSGYMNNEEETRRDVDEDGFLHTGDVGYFDDEGYLYIDGRIKEIINYKGFKVSPAQIESIILQHPSIKDVAVVGRPDQRCGELPTAFVVKETNSEVSGEDIVNFVKGYVPTEKQLHGGVIFIDEIPRNSVHKIDRLKLKELLMQTFVSRSCKL